jgi:hypothetical protein
MVLLAATSCPTTSPTVTINSFKPTTTHQNNHTHTTQVMVRTSDTNVNISVDLNPPHRATDQRPEQQAAVVRVAATARDATNTPIGVTVALEPYRRDGPTPFAGPYYQHSCFPRFEHADTIVTESDSRAKKSPRHENSSDSHGSDADSITWYHWNSANTTFFNDTIRAQASKRISLATLTPSSHMQSLS